MRHLLILFMTFKLLRQGVASYGVSPCAGPTWIFYEKENKCFAVSKTALQYYPSKAFCAGLNANLAKIESEDTTDFLSQKKILEQNDFWIGLQVNNKVFTWNSGEVMKKTDYQKWADQRFQTRGCVYIKPPEWHWDDHDCFEKSKAKLGLCEMTDVDQCAPGSKYEKKCDMMCITDGFNQSHCECHPGYKLISDTTCTDIDECKGGNNTCDHECVNTKGSYNCKCRQGYKLEGTRCIATGRFSIGLLSFILPLFSLIICGILIFLAKKKRSQETAAKENPIEEPMDNPLETEEAVDQDKEEEEKNDAAAVSQDNNSDL